MKVKILSCSDDDLWYQDQIGNDFFVIEYKEYKHVQAYHVPYPLGCKLPMLLILKSDCEVIKE